MLKVYGYYTLNWNVDRRRFSGRAVRTTVGELELRAVYLPDDEHERYGADVRARRHAADRLALAARFQLHAEPASLRTLNLQLIADFFNVNNSQTGYNYQPSVHDSAFNTPRDYFD